MFTSLILNLGIVVVTTEGREQQIEREVVITTHVAKNDTVVVSPVCVSFCSRTKIAASYWLWSGKYMLG